MENVNDIQSVPSNITVQTNEPKIGMVTHQQPPPTYGQATIQAGQIFHQNPTGPAYICQNGKMIAVPYITNGMNGLYPVRRTASAKDYLNIVWSVINTFCCIWPLGIIALVISIVALRMRRSGDDRGARCTGISAAVINVLATIGGIFLIIFYFVPLLNSYNQR
jgi:hypothetical protein